MTHSNVVRGAPARAAVLALLLGALAACEEGADGPSFLQPKAKTEQAGGSTTSTKLVERDVEAPEAFQVTEAGLWDGRPSLGGVWVAHPDVGEPERVIIRNTANGKFVIGALFRRERAIPGPRIQASSDAAAALGMLAGAPVQLNVTALRREAIEETPPPEPAATPAPEPAAQVAAVPDAGKVEETPLDPVATDAAAAIDAAEPTKKEKTGLFGWRKKPAEPSAADVTAAAAASAAAVEAATPAPAPATPPAKPAAKPKASSLAKPYIQIGIFSVESNAKRTADQMRAAGMIPTVYEQQANGKAFWRVVVGPAQTKSDASALLKQVQAAGFSDAYFVTN